MRVWKGLWLVGLVMGGPAMAAPLPDATGLYVMGANTAAAATPFSGVLKSAAIIWHPRAAALDPAGASTRHCYWTGMPDAGGALCETDPAEARRMREQKRQDMARRMFQNLPD